MVVRRYVLKRIRRGLITLWLTTLAVFMLLRITGNPIDFLATPQISPEDLEVLKAHYGFDKPIYVQYGIFIQSIFTGNFGKSMRWAQRDALDMYMSRLPATVLLVGSALVFSMVLGLAFGVLSATRPESLMDRAVQVLAITGQAMPAFWLGLLFILLFTVYLGWLPSAGGPERIGLKGLIMPAASLGWFLVAANTRLVRSSMLDALDSDYIKMVRAKGMPYGVVVWKHALKNAALPIITLFAVNFGVRYRRDLRGGAQLPGSRDSAAGVVLGNHAGGVSAIPLQRLVVVRVPWYGHLPAGDGKQSHG